MADGLLQIKVEDIFLSSTDCASNGLSNGVESTDCASNGLFNGVECLPTVKRESERFDYEGNENNHSGAAESRQSPVKRQKKNPCASKMVEDSIMTKKVQSVKMEDFSSMENGVSSPISFDLPLKIKVEKEDELPPGDEGSFDTGFSVGIKTGLVTKTEDKRSIEGRENSFQMTEDTAGQQIPHNLVSSLVESSVGVKKKLTEEEEKEEKEVGDVELLVEEERKEENLKVEAVLEEEVEILEKEEKPNIEVVELEEEEENVSDNNSKTENQAETEFEENLFQFAVKHKETAVDIKNEYDSGFSSSHAVVKEENYSGVYYFNDSEESKIYYESSPFKLIQVSVVLEDMFPVVKRKKRKEILDTFFLEHFILGSCHQKFKTEPSNLKKSKPKALPFFCGFCAAAFNSQRMLKSHLPVHLKETEFPCQFCTAVFKSKVRLNSHVACHNIEKCHQCGALFTTKVELDSHLAFHSKDWFHCKRCTASFKTKVKLKAHLDFHSKKKNLSCKSCKISFKTMIELKSHKAFHSENKFYCEHCTASFERKLKLRSHLVCHSKEKIFHCEHCTNSFRTEVRLKSHLAFHSVRFHCDYCIASFKTKTQLKRHKVLHVKEGKFFCEYCAASFKIKYDLKQHLPVHSIEKFFLCEYCPATFKTEDRFNNHLVFHSFDRCQKELLEDMKMRVNEKLLCKYCSARFKTMYELKSHLAFHYEKPSSSEVQIDIDFDEKPLREIKSEIELEPYAASHFDEKPFLGDTELQIEPYSDIRSDAELSKEVLSEHSYAMSDAPQLGPAAIYSAEEQLNGNYSATLKTEFQPELNSEKPDLSEKCASTTTVHQFESHSNYRLLIPINIQNIVRFE